MAVGDAFMNNNQLLHRGNVSEARDTSDNALPSKTVAGAMPESIPTTLTRWRRECWYAIHGMPELCHGKTNLRTSDAL